MNVGEVGITLTATVTNSGSALDLSAYANRELNFVSPTDVVSTFSASAVTDWTDGQVSYTTAASSDFSESGVWEVYFTATLSSPTQSIKTTSNFFKVGA